MRAFLLVFIFAISLNCWGKNNGISTFFNQVDLGGGCELGPRCGSQNLDLPRLVRSSQQIVEKNAFQKAAEIQTNKDQCFLDQATKVVNDQKFADFMLNALMRVWLSYKKTELILKTCEKIQNTQIVERNQLSNRKKTQFDPKWAEFCNDENQVKPLLASKELFKLALPFLQSQEALEVMEKWRLNLTIKKTAKALSDEDILAMKIYNFTGRGSDPESAETIAYNKSLFDSSEKAKAMAEKSEELNQYSVKFKITKGLENDYMDLFKKLYQERRTSLEKLYRAKNKSQDGKTYILDQNLKDYIYEEGSLKEALESSGNENSIAGKCIMAEYEPSIKGELTTFGAESVAGGFVIKTAAKAALRVGIAQALRWGKQVESASQTQRSFMLGSLVVGGKEGATQFAKCLSTPIGIQKIDKGKSDKVKVQRADLPAEVGYKHYAVGSDEGSTPACKALNTPDLIMHELSAAHCIAEGLLNFAPLAISLPGSFLLGN
jgi:hypothetical protein